MIVTNKSTSAYVYTVLNISDRDLMFSPNHMCLLLVNAMTLLSTYFEIRIMPEKLYWINLVREDNTLLFSLLRFIPTCFAYSFIRV